MAAPSILVKGNVSANVYTTDGIQKNGPWTISQQQQLLFCGAAVWNDATGAPFVLDQTLVNALDTT